MDRNRLWQGPSCLSWNFDDITARTSGRLEQTQRIQGNQHGRPGIRQDRWPEIE